MKQLIPCLLVLLAFAAPGIAQTAASPPTEVLLNTWPFAATDTIESTGIVLGSPDGTYGSRRSLTLYDFAVAIARVFAQMSASIPANDTAERLRKSPLAVNALLALVQEFSPELNKLGQDIPEATTRLKTMQEQQRHDIRDGKMTLTPEQGKNPFADVPQTDPARHNQDTLAKSGIVLGYPDGTWSGYPPEIRLQMAIDVTRLFAQMPSFSDLAERIQQSPQDFPALRAFVTEFTPELKLLGQNTDAYQTWLVELEKTASHLLAAKPFLDVPENHWAASSVETLRRHGLVAGYPDGAYTTK